MEGANCMSSKFCFCCSTIIVQYFLLVTFFVWLNFHCAYIDSHPKHPKPQNLTSNQINVFGQPPKQTSHNNHFPTSRNRFCGLDWCVSSSKYPVPNFDLRTEETRKCCRRTVQIVPTAPPTPNPQCHRKHQEIAGLMIVDHDHQQWRS